ncbi:uncharacterized protein E0L32_007774 [Thyridium curvatum]|uniref:Heterokaryon incompatibility domain-containing protein n=1 Tax=Thyridium curvatum TaxID=1093900 RepID=A0A507AV11_9PEZI|nr:uncharacterized protein E0L32_007774 [Thyridium curvatum]TPX11563.1 hypothetical protein E0L32_007774 [Thyridium curvatum]
MSKMNDMMWEVHLSVFQASIATNERFMSSALIPKSTRKNLFNPNRRLKKYQERSKERQELAIKDPAHADTYTYQPLKPNEIRLLHILPAASPEEEVKCTLTVESLDDGKGRPSFEALSYTWGDPSEEHTVLCDGKSILVTRNFLAAVRDIRLADRPRVFWIDGVCINQGDMEERSVQVQLMDSIYRMADSVVVWLSEPSTDTELGFKLMRQLGKLAEETPPELWDKPMFEADLARYSLPPTESNEWTALESLYWQPWFGRIWIVQEITVARSAGIICGKDSIPWETFAFVSHFFYRRNFRGVTRLDITPGLNLLAMRETYQKGTRPDLLGLLSNFRQSLATNPIDKVYALLNLAADAKIIPDYSLSAPEVFRNLAASFLKESLDILNLNSDPAWKLLEDELPTWVPDWSCASREYPLLFTPKGRSWRAGGPPGEPPAVRFSDDGSRFYVRARVVGEVRDIGETMMSAAQLEMQRVYGDGIARRPVGITLGWSRERRWRMWERLVLRLKAYPATGEDIRSVLQQTLVGGADVVAEVPPGGPDLEQLYMAFRRAEIPDGSGGEAASGASHDEISAWRFSRAATVASQGRKIFTTKGGLAGLGPHSTLPGTLVVLFQGGKTAYIVKKGKKAGEYKFLGEAYLHGYMDGEGVKEGEEWAELCLV